MELIGNQNDIISDLGDKIILLNKALEDVTSSEERDRVQSGNRFLTCEITPLTEDDTLTLLVILRNKWEESIVNLSKESKQDNIKRLKDTFMRLSRSIDSALKI